MDVRLLLLSNSRNHGMQFLEHAKQPIRDFLGPKVRRVAFIPYAAVTLGSDEYSDLVARHFAGYSVEVTAVHAVTHAARALRDADAIVVGGGNTFRLLQQLRDNRLLDPIRERVLDGTPYVGWSAGSNVACPTIRTTNDMPIVDPAGFEALGLISFQINPHYLDTHPDGHQGETREQRIEEFVELNRDSFVVGLREGSILRVEGGGVDLLGGLPARIFGWSRPPIEVAPGGDLSFLLERPKT